MGIKSLNPTTPSLRFTSLNTNEEISKKTPEKSLLAPLKRKGGRNNNGHITSRFIGGGHKRAYRMIDFKRSKRDIPGKVVGIEYDPNRSANIALIQYADGERRYILAPVGLKAGDAVVAGEKAEIRVGNALPLKLMPVGSTVHNVELKIGRGGQLARSAGSYAQLIGRGDKYAQLKLPSGEIRIVLAECYATLGQVGNTDHENRSAGKAGRNRWRGIRPRNRGVSMNPVDHPHGGGEGKAAQGNPHPVTPWGKPTKGFKTRKKNKPTNKFIIRRRGKK